MEDWLKVLFSGFGGNIVVFVLGLLIGGVAGRGIEVQRNKIRVGTNGKLAYKVENSTVSFNGVSNKGAKAVIESKDSEINI